ncbi:hypothetical protein C8R44DRAFT_808644 [Mycena epipterygia]|nr:hypothetical protein C8R44DRAFT_808644 [Mycena epipterygia]
MSRPPTTDSPTNESAAGVESLLEQLQADNSEEPSSGSAHRRMSKDSEGYPSWLPKRPPHPAPASTFQSSVHEAGPSEQPFVGGRKPTPRSVRIVSLQDTAYGDKDRREPTDQTRVGIPPPRVWSRGMGTPLSPTVFSSADDSQPRPPQPKFHATGLHLELLQNPGLKFRLYFYLFPLFVFAHIPLQTFFDFNAVFMLIQISKFPNPDAPGVPGSGRNWALAAAAYVACWLVWVFPIFVVYELVYSFARRWRVKRPIMLPLYLSSSAFNLVSMSSFANFCFMQHIRYSAFVGENGSFRDGMAETFWFYSQNLPTVTLLLPRAGLCLALLLAFSAPDVAIVALADAGVSHRDSTFFRSEDGTLTSYARGLLIANAAWTAWRALVVLSSWIGLWVVSGSGCAGLCGPRHRWEEDDAEKTMSIYSENISDLEALPWSWREATTLRVQAAFEFCLTVRPSSRWSQQRKKDVTDTSELLGGPLTPEPFGGMEQVMAAVGFPSAPPQARRGMLSGDLFETPTTQSAPDFGDIIPKVAKRSSKDRTAGPSSPLMSLPYPFTAPGAQMSSQDRVPFPPSPGPTDDKESSGSLEEEEVDEEEDDEDDEDEDEEDEDEEEEEEEDLGEGVASEEPSSGRASGSMSSLGQPVTSRYPFQFRRPARGHSASSGAPSHISPASHNTRSTQSGVSQATQSTGNQESSDSQSPRSHYTVSSDHASSRYASAGVIPMPPRHPQQGRSRTRAGTVPAPSGSSSPSPVDFPRTGRPRARTRMDSGGTDTFGPAPAVPQGVSDVEQEMEQVIEPAESEGSHEAEREDRLGLLSLSAAPSPKSSFTALRHRASNLSHHRRTYGSGSGSSHSRTHSHSGSSSSRSRAGSISVSVRSRAQSLLQNIGAASHSSLELVQGAVRLRANSSMARLEEDSSDARTNTHSRSGSGSDALQSSGENNTFGHPLRTQWHDTEEQPTVQEEETPVQEEGAPAADSRWLSPSRLQPSQSRTSVFTAPSTQQPSERTVSRPPTPERLLAESSGIPIIREGQDVGSSASFTSSYPDISTAPQSFVTAPGTIEGTTDSSGRTISSWGGISHMVDRSQGGTWRHPGPA